MKWFRCLLIVAVLSVSSALTARAEEVIEAWRSTFGECRAVSVNASDGSCWVADGSALLHLAADGTIIDQVTGFREPCGLSVNSADGSCWVVDVHHWDAELQREVCSVVHLAEDGTEVWRGSDFAGAGWGDSVSVNPTDGSCWVADSANDRVVHLAADGTVVGQISGFDEPWGLAVNPTDGSCWVIDIVNGFSEADDAIIHLAEDGSELSRSTGFGEPQSVDVNPTDGSCWAALWREDKVVHLASDGTELWRGGFFDGPASLSVNPTDGSCWVTDYHHECIVHLAEDGSELWRGGISTINTGCHVSVDPTDGSCWICASRQVVHLADSGAELWRGEGDFNGPHSVAVNSGDGSCWVADTGNDAVVHLAEDGTELWRREGLEDPSYVVVNPTDGSCWASGVSWTVHLAEDGTELWQGGAGAKLSINPTDGSCWAAEGDTDEVVHLAADGTELWRGGGYGEFGWYDCVSANPTDGSCWVADYGRDAVIHLAENGTVLRYIGLSVMFNPFSVAVDPADGSCWVAGGDGAFLLLAEDGTQLRSFVGPSYPSISLNPADRTLWVASYGNRVVHFAADGTELWRGVGFRRPWSISVNASDGSCWVADTRNRQVVHLVIPGWRAPVFPDVASYHWAFDEVEACYEAGIVAGYDDGLYHPSYPVDRGQMAVYISRALAGGDEYVPEFTESPTFPDVGDTHWALDYVEYAAAQNVVAGYDDGSYHPEYQVTRDQMAVYVARALVAPEGEVGLADYVPADPRNFPDVPSDHWAYRHIEYCVENGVVAGYLDGNYHPEGVVTRDQMAVYVARAFGL